MKVVRDGHSIVITIKETDLGHSRMKKVRNEHCWHFLKLHPSMNRTEECCLCGLKRQVDSRKPYSANLAECQRIAKSARTQEA